MLGFDRPDDTTERRREQPRPEGRGLVVHTLTSVSDLVPVSVSALLRGFIQVRS